MEDYAAQYLCEFVPSAKDAKARELAEFYHAQTEAFDRMVCTGPVRDGGIMPMTHKELAAINDNARRIFAETLREAAKHAISAEEMRREIGRAA